MLTCSSFSLPSQVSSISAPQIQSTCRSTSFVFFTFLCVYAPESFHKKLSSYFAHPLLLSSQARQTTGRLLTMLVCYAEHGLDGKTGPCALTCSSVMGVMFFFLCLIIKLLSIQHIGLFSIFIIHHQLYICICKIIIIIVKKRN